MITPDKNFVPERYLLFLAKKVSKKWNMLEHFEDIHQIVWAEYLSKKDIFKGPENNYRLKMECWNAARDYCMDELYGSRGNHRIKISELKKKSLSFEPLNYITGSVSIIDKRAENRELLFKIKQACEKNKNVKKKNKYLETLKILMENAGEERTYLSNIDRGGLNKGAFSFRVKQLREMLEKSELRNI